MTLKMTIDDFLNSLQRSNLLDDELFDKVKRRVEKSQNDVDPRQVARSLVTRGNLTLWQSRQLLAGRSDFFLGRYKLLDRIGKGGMGVVFKAQHAVMDRIVALKVMARSLLKKPNAVPRFNREVKSVAALNHPNIISAFDAARAGNTHFLVMEYVDGRDLSYWLSTKGRFPVSLACEFAMQSAEGLEHAFRQGMVHRDIKPGNLLVAYNPENETAMIKILDLGLARFVSESQEEDGLTRAGQAIGTPDYLAPEAAENFRGADIRADIFSLGCALFKMLTGRLPFRGKTTIEKLMARVKDEAPPASSLCDDVPPELDAIVAKMLKREPGDRYQTPSEVSQALAPFAASTIGDLTVFEMFKTLPAESEGLSTEQFVADADSSLEDFFRDFSAAPLLDEAPSDPGTTPVAREYDDADLGFAPLADEPKTASAPKPSAKQENDEPKKRRAEKPSEAAAVASAEPDEDEPPMAVVEDDNPNEELLGEPVLAQDDDPLSSSRRERRVGGLREAPALKKNVWDSSLLLVGGGLVLLFVLAIGALVWALSRGSADAAFEMAEQDYRDAKYTQAIHKFDKYLEDYSGDVNAGKARVLRGLARLYQSVDAGRDWAKRLDDANGVLDEISSEVNFRTEASSDLAGLLPEIAAGLAAQANKEGSAELVERTDEALQLINRYVPADKRPRDKLQEIEQSLALTRRELARDDALAEALATINAATEANETERAYQTRKELLKAYPDLVENTELKAAELALSQAQLSAVRVDDTQRAALTEEPPTDVEATATLVDRQGESAAGSEGQKVFVIAGGAAYGLDAASGQALWRRFIGFDTAWVPQLVSSSSDSDVVLVDSTRSEIVRLSASDGSLRWRQPLDEPLAAGPVRVNGEYLAATTTGRLARIDAESGALAGSIVLPQSLSVSPALSSDRKTVYQVADHSNLYVLALGDTEEACKEVVYLAHEPGSIPTAPLVVDRYVIIAENHRLNESRLRVFLTDENGQGAKQIQEVTIDGHVLVPPVAAERNLHVVSDRGAVYLFEIGPPDGSVPLTKIAQIEADKSDPVIRYIAVDRQNLWVAARGVTKYEVQAARGRLAPAGTRFRDDVFLQSPQPVGEAVICTRRRDGFAGVVVSAIRAKNNEPLWEVQLATPPAGNGMIGKDEDELLVFDTAGRFFRVTRGQFESDGAVIEASARAEIRQPLPHGAKAVDLDKGQLAVTGGHGADRALLYDPRESNGALAELRLPDPLASPAVGLGDGLLAAGARGQVFLISPAGGGRIEPFEPRFEAGTPPEFRRPTACDDGTVLLTDGRNTLYRLGIAEQPTPHLEALAQVRIEETIVAPPAAVGSVAYVVTSAGDVLSFSLPKLEAAGEPTKIQGQVVWGPERVGNHMFLATDEDQLYCFDDAHHMAWQAPLNYGPLAGSPLESNDGFVLASMSGVVWRLSSDGQNELARQDVGQPLAGGPVILGDRLIVPGASGTLHALFRL